MITQLKTPGKNSFILIIIIAAVFFFALLISILKNRPEDFTGTWINKTDSTRVLLVLEKDNSGKIELYAKKEIFDVRITNYSVHKTDSSMTLFLKYGNRNEYPEFFYNFYKFEVAHKSKDSLIMVSTSIDKKSNWWLRMRKE